ncbi:hypothetical protein OROGR_034003 [Orobanche gracilis]
MTDQATNYGYSQETRDSINFFLARPEALISSLKNNFIRAHGSHIKDTDKEVVLINFWYDYFSTKLTEKMDEIECEETSDKIPPEGNLLQNDGRTIRNDVSRSVFTKTYKDKVFKLLEKYKNTDLCYDDLYRIQKEIESLTMVFNEENIFSRSPSLIKEMSSGDQLSAKEYLMCKYKLDKRRDGRLKVVTSKDQMTEKGTELLDVLTPQEKRLLDKFGHHTIEALLIHILSSLFSSENLVKVAALVDRIESAVRHNASILSNYKNYAVVDINEECDIPKKDPLRLPFGKALVEFLVERKMIQIREKDDDLSPPKIQKKKKSYYLMNLPMIYPPLEWKSECPPEKTFAFLDFRGRIYRSGILHFHERDLARSLIQFADDNQYSISNESETGRKLVLSLMESTSFHYRKFSTYVEAIEFHLHQINSVQNTNGWWNKNKSPRDLVYRELAKEASYHAKNPFQFLSQLQCLEDLRGVELLSFLKKNLEEEGLSGDGPNCIWVYDKQSKKRRKVTLRVSSDKRDSKKTEVSTFVNFIHQKDAYIAMKVVDSMTHNSPIYTVHDNFISNVQNSGKLPKIYLQTIKNLGPPLQIINDFLIQNLFIPVNKSGYDTRPDRSIPGDMLDYYLGLNIPDHIQKDKRRRNAWDNNVCRLKTYYSKYVKNTARYDVSEEDLVGVISKTMASSPHPNLLIATHCFPEPYPVISQTMRLSLSTMDLLLLNAYPCQFGYAKFTILLTMIKEVGDAFTFTIGKAIPLTSDDGVFLPKSDIFSYITDDLLKYIELYEGSVVTRITIHVYSSDKSVDKTGSNSLSINERKELLNELFHNSDSSTSIKRPTALKIRNRNKTYAEKYITSLKSNATKPEPFLVADTETIMLNKVHTPYAAGVMMVHPSYKLDTNDIYSYFSEDYSTHLYDSFEKRSRQLLYDFIIKISFLDETKSFDEDYLLSQLRTIRWDFPPEPHCITSS